MPESNEARAPNRPGYWSPDFVIHQLREGRRVSDLIRMVRKDLGLTEADDTPTERSMWNDIHAWRRKVPGWDERYQEAMVVCYEVRGEVPHGAPVGVDDGRRPDFGPRLQAAFFAEMANNGGKMNEACYDIGISPSCVLTRIDPKSPNFDQDFDDRFRRFESARYAEAYKKVWERALGEDGEKASEYLLHKVLEAGMPHKFNAKKSIEIEGYIRHDHRELPSAVTRQLAHQSKAFKREPEAIEGEILEETEVS